MAATSAVPTMPPGPRLPPALQTLLFVFAPRRFIGASWRRYGDVVHFRTRFDPRFVLVFHPRQVRQVFKAPPDVLRAGEANALLGPVVGARSVLLLDGEEHLRHRRLMLPPFHGRRMKAYEAEVLGATDRALERWPVGRPFALLPEMQAITLDVISGAVFGLQEGARAEELKRRLRAMLDPLSTRLGLVALMLSGGRVGDRGAMRRFEASRAAVDELLYEEIATRREPTERERASVSERKGDDIFSLLLSARDEEGRGLTDSELRDELVTLLVAGHETTAAGLAWTFELVGRHPEVLRRLREAFAAADDAYPDAVVKEALRLRPVIAGVGRKVRTPFELGGYLLPPGTEINPSIAVVHRRPDLYPEPEAFRPERFLDPEQAPDTYTWIPFGGGVRRCLGASFALFEMRTVLSRVVERTELRPARRKPEPVLRRGITQVPEHGARAIQPAPPRPPA
jgi:cytochrome P450 family 135